VAAPLVSFVSFHAALLSLRHASPVMRRAPRFCQVASTDGNRWLAPLAAPAAPVLHVIVDEATLADPGTGP